MELSGPSSIDGVDALNGISPERIVIAALDPGTPAFAVDRLHAVWPRARVIRFADRPSAASGTMPKSTLSGLSKARGLEADAVVAANAARKLLVFSLAVPASAGAFVLRGDRIERVTAAGLVRDQGGFLRARQRLLRGHEILAYAGSAMPKIARFYVVSCGRHAGRAAVRCLDSVLAQAYPKDLVQHLYIDDASTDGTRAQVRAWLAQNPENRVRYVETSDRRGGTLNTLRAFRGAPAGSIVVELNGDDWLPDEGVFSWLDRVYWDPSVWLTYNSCTYADGKARRLNRAYPSEVVSNNGFRRAPWHAGALRTFRSELFTHVRDGEMRDPRTGKPWQSADDQAIFLALLELCGQHSRHVERTTYVYNLRASSEVVKDHEGSEACARLIRQMPRRSPLEYLAPVPDADGPLISVLMPVYNAGPFLELAVRSILQQTYARFELVIVDDGSTDGSGAIAQHLADQDSRVRVVSQPNQGLVGALGTALSEARGSLLARMDADDLCPPHRLARQAAILRDHPEWVAVGSWVTRIDGRGERLTRDWRPPTSPGAIRWALCFESCLPHGSVMMRTAAVKRVGGYREEAKHAEDYDLWIRLLRVGELANVPEALMSLRIHDDRVGVRHGSAQFEQSARLAGERMAEVLGRSLASDTARGLFALHRRITPGADVDVIREALMELVDAVMAKEPVGESGRYHVRRDAAKKLAWLGRSVLPRSSTAAARALRDAWRTAPPGFAGPAGHAAVGFLSWWSRAR